MRARDVVVLLVLIVLVLALTVVEKYGEHRREAQREQAAATERLQWQNQMARTLDERWKDLSSHLRKSLDSLVGATVAAGVPFDSLAAVINASDFSPAVPPPDLIEAKVTAAPRDSLARAVASEYRRSIATLPGDLNAYERRVALGEVKSMMQARFGLSPAGFDSLLSLAGR